MKAIFIITGLPTSGKTTLITLMNNVFIHPHNLYYSRIIEDKLKHLSPKTPTKRQSYYLDKIKGLLLQSSIVSDYIIDSLKKRDTENSIFFIECDNPKDIILIRKAYPRKVKVIYINKKDKFESPYFTLNDFVYDYKINNDGNLQRFKENIYSFIRDNIAKKYKIKGLEVVLTFKLK